MKNIKRIGYKTLQDYIKILKQQNRILKKLGIKSEFRITLPIKVDMDNKEILKHREEIICLRDKEINTLKSRNQLLEDVNTNFINHNNELRQMSKALKSRNKELASALRQLLADCEGYLDIEATGTKKQVLEVLSKESES